MGTVRSLDRQLKACLTASLISAIPAWAHTTLDVGLLYQRYTEPNMSLNGPGLYVGVERHTGDTRWWVPQSGRASAVVGQLAYGSERTGTLKSVPWLHMQMGLRWRLPSWAGHSWSTGPILELQWTDLRGSSSTGHRGYERLGIRGWWGIDISPAPDTRLSAAMLLHGRQHSQLSQANPSIPNVVNRQTSGWWLQLELAPIERLAQFQPWIEVKQIAESDKQGLQSWHEPDNTQWQIGLRKRF